MKSVHQGNEYLTKLDNIDKKISSVDKKSRKTYDNLTKEKLTLVNVDSRFRVKDPKNITENEFKVLSNNPLSINQDSNQIKVFDKNHNFKVEDKIVVKNVKNTFDIFSNGLKFLINSFYVLVYHKNHQISNSYKNYNNVFEITMSDVTGILDENYIDNIPINILNTIHDILIYNDNILDVLSIKSGHKVIVDNMYNYLEYLKNEDIDEFNNVIQNYYLIKLPLKYKNINTEIKLTTQISSLGVNFNTYTYPGNTKIQINNLGGIPYNLINADYPVNYLQKQGFQTISKIEKDYYYFETNIKAYTNKTNIGGNNIIVTKINKFIEGYPSSSSYSILLKKTFYNINKIELVSSEFPSTEKIVKSDTNQKNNVLQWQNIEDGNYIYSITIPQGNYNRITLTKTLTDKMNLVERIISDSNTKFYHLFELSIDTSTDEVIFNSFKEVKLSKPFSVENITINNEKRIKLVIKHQNNTVVVGDTIKISGSKSTNGISAQNINTTHIVYEVNNDNDTYSVVLPKININTVTTDTSGGESVVIRVGFLVRFFFNKNNSAGSILGFRDVGKNNAITRFSNKVSNKDSYELEGSSSVNLNSAGLEKKIDSNILNFTGENLYIYLTLNDYSNIITSNEINNAFAKILLTGNPGDILFNTFVPAIKEFDQPIAQLNELKISFLNPDGSLVDFNNINHSFTLKITEQINRPINTLLNTRFQIDNNSVVNLDDEIE